MIFFIVIFRYLVLELFLGFLMKLVWMRVRFRMERFMERREEVY